MANTHIVVLSPDRVLILSNEEVIVSKVIDAWGLITLAGNLGNPPICVDVGNFEGQRIIHGLRELNYPHIMIQKGDR